MATLQEAIADLQTETGGLNQTVRDKQGQIDARVLQAEQQVTDFIQAGAATRPVTPNLLPDSKHFANLCGGALNTILAWDNGGAGTPWNVVFQNSTGTCDIEVVYAYDIPRLTALGLWPLGDMASLVRAFPHPTIPDYGVDNHIAIFDIVITDWTYNELTNSFIPLYFAHDCFSYTSWFLPDSWSTQLSYFINILSVDGLEFDFGRRSHGHQTRIGLGAPEGLPVNLGANIVGQGWKHISGGRSGFGGCNSSYVLSVDDHTITPLNPAHIKFAIALPYQGYGDHQGLPIWAGAGPRWDIGDGI